MRPPSKSGRDFQDRAYRQTVVYPRKNCAPPLRGRAAPRSRPFLARFFPVVLHGIDRIIANPALIEMLLSASSAENPPGACGRKIVRHSSTSTQLFSLADGADEASPTAD